MTSEVDVKLSTLDNGDSVECYKWETPVYLFGSDRAFSLPTPSFPVGALESSSWREKAKVEFFGKIVQVVLPYPKSRPFNDDGIVWRIDDVLVSIMPNATTIVPLTINRHGRAGWNTKEPETYAAMTDIHYDCGSLPPPRLCLSVRIVGTQEGDKDKNAQVNIGTSIQNIFNTSELSDVKIVCQDETFLCHKLILSVGSSVFKRMFLSNTKESLEGKVRIMDVEKNVLRLMLAWMYGIDISDKIQTSKQRVALYRLADRYLLDSLKGSLVDDILLFLTADNAFDFYILGDTYGEERFKTKATEVMKRERDVVFSTVEVFHECYRRFPNLLHEIVIVKEK